MNYKAKATLLSDGATQVWSVETGRQGLRSGRTYKVHMKDGRVVEILSATSAPLPEGLATTLRQLVMAAIKKELP